MKSVFNCLLMCSDLKHGLKYSIQPGVGSRAGTEHVLKALNPVQKQTLTSDLLPGAFIELHFAFLLPHSGHDLEGTTVGLAFVKSICSDTHSTGIIQVGFIFVYSTF